MVERRVYRHTDEDQLIAWAQDGDERAFRALIEPYRPMLQSVCGRIAGSRSETEDAIQVALLAVWQNIARFEHRSKFSTWLFRVCHNAALGVVRKRVPEPAGDEYHEPLSSTTTPDAKVSDVDAVRWALNKIPPDFRAALVLREYAQMSYSEIAETQGIKVETVKTRIARARRALADLLADRI
ncbi:MAG: ECF RNA polymerase sigma factor SigW [Acidimicrobiales bacterium]|nr:MAG: RNA polymerase sigma factor [Actinomycetota bacterium]MBV6507732.1 ECF RNA polymerase sigma factor SigW [Acidimicrobiales bacterium]RIK07656.1 MAG: RNA polymerase subunit sigma [Acidobacteriota bacterium]